jgi:peptidoglycan/LPS O-acetylase OafA/YrhL
LGLIRIFLAFVVVADHLLQIGFRRASAGGATFVLYNGEWKLGFSGPQAVLCFYILSGFLISYVIEQRYRSDTKGFYIARGARIYSLFWPLFIFSFVFNVWDTRNWVASPLDALTGFFLFGSDWRLTLADYPNQYWHMFPHNLAVAWTLGAEMSFYLLAPVLLRRARIAVIVVLGSFGFRALYQSLYGQDAFIDQFFPATIGFFLVGHFSRLAWNRIAEQRNLFHAASGAVLLLLTAYFSTMQYAASATPRLVYFYPAMLCFALAVPPVFAWTRDIRWMNILGNLSYPVYLVHMTVLFFLFLPQGPFARMGQWLISYGLTFGDPVLGGEIVTAAFMVICLASAAVVHWGLENPVRRLIVATAGHLGTLIPRKNPSAATLGHA